MSTERVLASRVPESRISAVFVVAAASAAAGGAAVALVRPTYVVGATAALAALAVGGAAAAIGDHDARKPRWRPRLSARSAVLAGWVVFVAATLLAAVAGASAPGARPWVAAFAGATAIWLVLAVRSGVIVAGLVLLTLGLPVYGVPWIAGAGSNLGLLSLVLVVLLVSLLVARPRAIAAAARTRALWPTFIFSALAAVSLVDGVRGPGSATIAKLYVGRALLLPLLVTAAILALPRDVAVRLLSRLGTALIILGALGGVLSLVQVATSHGYPDAASASVAQFVGKRAIGFSEAAGTWAAFLVIPLGFALARWRRTRSLVYALATFAITIGVILSGLRTAWLALIAVAVVAAFLRGGSRRVRLALPLLLVVALAVTLASGNFQHYLAGGRATWNSLSFGHGRLGEDESAQERFLLMHAEIDLGVRHPLTGVGLGNIGPRLGTLHRSFRNSSGTVLLTPGEPIEKHDVFTGLFAELGLPGVAAFGAVLITTATVLLRARAAARRRAESEIVEALLLTLFATALLSLATEADRQVFLWWVVGVAAALGAVLRETMRAEPVRRRMKPAVYPARFERYYWSRQW